jgi:hypothetical protein
MIETLLPDSIFNNNAGYKLLVGELSNMNKLLLNRFC